MNFLLNLFLGHQIDLTELILWEVRASQNSFFSRANEAHYLMASSCTESQMAILPSRGEVP